MTPKEAIAELKKVDTLDMPARLCEAHYMAIDALKKEAEIYDLIHSPAKVYEEAKYDG